MSASRLQNSNTTIKTTWLMVNLSFGAFQSQQHHRDNNLTRVIPLSATSCPTLSRIPRTRSQVLQFFPSEGEQGLSLIKIGFYAMIGD